jgi:hypothetical protein
MAYDSARGVSVLYRGGLDGVWEWDGSQWSSFASSGPAENVSSGAAMTYDSFRGETLFGPTQDGITPEDYFWSWDGASLKYVGPAFGSGPFGSQGAMVFDNYRRRDVFFGGSDGYYANNATAFWDGMNWVLLPDPAQTSLFSTNDFVNLPSLVAKLQTHTDPVSQFVWANLPAAIQGVLSDPTATPAQQQSNLVAGLNPILQGNAIYNADRFAGIALSTETLVLTSIFLYGSDLIRFNRLLLEDAYPEIARSPAAPSTRLNHVMAYDSARHAAVLQGGKTLYLARPLSS